MKLWLLALILFTAFSCAKKAQKTSIVVSHEFSFADDYKGGIVLVAERLDKAESFRTFLTTEKININLSNGAWKFGIIAWEGESDLDAGQAHFTGDHHCGYTLANISSSTPQVNLQISQDKCNDVAIFADNLRFADADSMYGDQFNEVKFRSCADDVPAATNDNSCTSNEGESQSFRISVISENRTKYPNGIPVQTLTSRCISKADYSLTKLRIPLSTEDNGVLEYRIESFESLDCTGVDKITIGPFGDVDRAPLINVHKDNSSSNDKNLILFRHTNNLVASIANIAIEMSDTSPIEWGVCRNIRIKLIDEDNNTVTDHADKSVQIYLSGSGSGSGSDFIFYQNPSCTVGSGQSVSSSSIIIPANTGFKDVSIHGFNNNFTFTANITSPTSSISHIFSYNNAILPPVYAELTYPQIQMLEPLLVNRYLIMNAVTTLSTNDIIIFKYMGGPLTKINVDSVNAGGFSMNLSYEYFLDPNTPYIDSAYLFQVNGNAKCLKLSTGDISLYTTLTNGDGYEICYNDIDFLNPFFYSGSGDSTGMYLINH